MRALPLAAMVVTLWGAGACGSASGDEAPPEQGHEELRVDLDGLSSDEAIDAIVVGYCARQLACGDVHLHCETESVDEPLECRATIEPADFDVCVSEYRQELVAEFAACGYDETSAPLIESCLNAIIGEPCQTEEELNAALENDIGGGLPPECDALDELWADC